MKKILQLVVFMTFCLGVKAQILVIPDVHGRTFWKEAVSMYPDMHVIFLGDYLDPYGGENISEKDALVNFQEILDFKKSNMERVTLLIGNHELHYLDMDLEFSRKDTINAPRIHDMLYENIILFRLATSAQCSGKTFLFSHAGILQTWWKKHFPNVASNADDVCNALNDKIISDESTITTFINEALMNISEIRGGEDETGSCLWADINEHNGKNGFPTDVYQVFGHSQLRKNAKIKKGYADLDCRQAFIITTDGKFLVAKKEVNK